MDALRNALKWGLPLVLAVLVFGVLLANGGWTAVLGLLLTVAVAAIIVVVFFCLLGLIAWVYHD